MSIFPLQGKRLSIVPFTSAFLTDRYVSWLNNPDVVKYSEQRHHKHTLASCRAYLESFADRDDEFFAIIADDQGLGHIGNISTAVDGPNAVADINIVIGETSAWGQGFGFEAWCLVMDHLFVNRGVRKVAAGTMSVNIPMLRIMEKSGMQADGQREKQLVVDGQEVDLVFAAKLSPSERTRISLDDLPRYSPWAGKLLGGEQILVNKRTPAQVLQEFDEEKWKALVSVLEADSELDLVGLERAEYSSIEEVAYEDGVFLLDNGFDQIAGHTERYAQVIGEFADGAAALVELGAGYGSKILALAGRSEFAELEVFAAELTPTGRSIILELARRGGVDITVGECDFSVPEIGSFGIPSDSVIFTSYATMYLPRLPQDFVSVISALRPRAVVHFEPCYDHFPTDTLHGLLCRRYLEFNDYNLDLAARLLDASDAGHIDILYKEPQVFGMNALMPVSVMVWRPTA